MSRQFLVSVLMQYLAASGHRQRTIAIEEKPEDTAARSNTILWKNWK